VCGTRALAIQWFRSLVYVKWRSAEFAVWPVWSGADGYAARTLLFYLHPQFGGVTAMAVELPATGMAVPGVLVAVWIGITASLLRR
jgi:hypothetical protein